MSDQHLTPEQRAHRDAVSSHRTRANTRGDVAPMVHGRTEPTGDVEQLAALLGHELRTHPDASGPTTNGRER